MRRIVLIGVWASVTAACVGFVQPWALIHSGKLQGRMNQALAGTGLEGLAKGFGGKVSRVTLQFKRGAETVVGDLPDLSKLPSQVNGPDIPAFVNRTDNAVAIALAEMLTGQAEIGKKSYAVYAVPGLALLTGVLLTVAGAPAVCWVLALASAGVAGAGFWKLLTIHTETLVVAITIGQGLWVSLWAYVGLAVCAAALALLPRTR